MDERSRRTATRTDTAPGGESVRRRHVLKAGAGGALGVSLAGCLDVYGSLTGGASDEDVVKIGLLAPDPTEGGEVAGFSMKNAAELAVSELNDPDSDIGTNELDEPGINGTDVELVVADTNDSSRETKRQYHELILEHDVDVTVGIFSSDGLMNIVDDIAEQETVHLTTGAATTQASSLVREEYESYKYHFRVGPRNDHDLAVCQLDFLEDMYDVLGWESITLLTEDHSWTQEIQNVYEDGFDDLAVDVVDHVRYSASKDDFTDVYDEAEAEGVDAVYVTMAHTGVPAVLDWAGNYPFAFAGIHVPLQYPQMWDTLGGRAEYAVTNATAAATAELTEYTIPFADKYLEEYDHQPVYSGYIAYDAIKLFAETATEIGTTESSELVEGLEEARFNGTTGTIEFYDESHDYPHDVVYGEDNVQSSFVQWQDDGDGNGVQEVIWPERIETAEYQEPEWD
ncbi:ABC transporter substrate-binding protein [Natrialbaceae archaeon GCM10025810]|uniref:ABC transporter substrate-binding protein n=1 Tax=Halovalidus salilacus TaxID=3075124 RepID=UPI00360789C9